MTSGFEIFENVVEIHQQELDVEENSREARMVEYVRSLATLEEAMEPYKEQKRELKKEYKEQGWLTGDEISTTVKAYRMMKSKSFDIDEFNKIFTTLTQLSGENT